jgi:hypothetical protein
MFCGLLTALLIVGFAIEAAKVRRREKSTDDGPEQLVKSLSVGLNPNARRDWLASNASDLIPSPHLHSCNDERKRPRPSTLNLD